MQDQIKMAEYLEKKGKEEKKDFKRKADYHQRAAKIWREMGPKWRKKWTWNMANYYSARGRDHLNAIPLFINQT